MDSSPPELRHAVRRRLYALLAELRNEQPSGRFTVLEFSKMISVERSAAQNWFNDKKGNLPPIWHAIAICEQTGVTLDWLYRGDYGSLPRDKSARLQAVEEGVVVPPILTEGEASASASEKASASGRTGKPAMASGSKSSRERSLDDPLPIKGAVASRRRKVQSPS